MPSGWRTAATRITSGLGIRRSASAVLPSDRLVQLAPTDSSAKAAPPNPCSLVLDYPPSASPSARWGYGQPTHRKLHDLIAAHDETYHAELQAIAGLAPELVGIELSAAEPDEPSWINDFLPGLDGAALYAFVRTRRPRRYLEIGSGNSTKFVARAKRDGALATKLLSVDPHPRAEIDRLCDVVIRQPFETIGLEPFAELDEGDIVFFDGSHRTFTNSDATVFFLEVLPMLAQGILVGVHDIYLPDDYPPDWNDRYYSEQYLLACYLLAGCAWLKPVLASWYASSHPALRLCLRELWANARMAGVEPHGGAFWMLIDR